MITRAVPFITLAAFLAGCGAINPLPKFGFGHETPEERRIGEMMFRHSGRVEVYRNFNTVFTARSVYLSPEIKRESADWEAKTRLMSPEEKKDLFMRVVGPREGKTEFLMGFYIPDGGANRLDQPDSPWKVFLRLPDGENIRGECFSVSEEDSQVYMRFLRWDLSWSRLYLVRFAASVDELDKSTGNAVITVSGPGGAGEMDIRLKPPPEE